ncbi:long-chain fatty acid-CoA ligase [Maudiozyma humilis]|uniref:Long-chain fatty acid-CoA ligase n=1 Tax=Maudiozyma humilis TaxID=51915 RepID=A0AAV5RZT9_MAUHU|nr:long-chain fatty acid-CoA ligase [Kazachstania humilis]
MVELYNVPVGKPANEHETAPRRNSRYQKKLLTRPIGMKCSTVYEFLVEIFERNGNTNAMGWREVIDIHEEKKIVNKVVDGKNVPTEKVWQYFEMSHYRYSTYTELTTIMHDIGRGLVKMGLEPGNKDRLHIFASTSHKWMKMFLGTQSQAIPVVTAYDTLGEAGLIHSMVQTGTAAVFTDSALLPKLIKPLQAAKEIKYIIHSETLNPKDKRQGGKMYSIPAEALKKIKEVRPDIMIYTFDEIVKLGQEAKGEIEPCPPKPEDLSCIMYTSGSTGDPKGVVLLHSTVTAGIAGVGSTVYGFMGPEDSIIAFLPLAHIFELVFEFECFYWGAVVGYGTVKTLSSISMRNCQGDLEELKPTLMVGVAAVWETIRKGILAKLAMQPRLVQKVFWAAYGTKTTLNKYHLPGGNALGNIIFKKVKEATGGRLKYMCNGGSPISLDAQTFLSNILCPMLVGYGLTETVASTTVTTPDRFEIGVVGDLAGSTTVKLVDVEDLGYFAKNNQGEIWAKGACITPEYYKNPEETAKAITPDGWFKTGDIGEFTANGHLKIIDRKKNLVKTMNGEYIALEKLESIYRSNKYVMNICCYADQTQVKAVGIVVPVIPALAKLAVSLGVMKQGEDVEQYVDNPKLCQAVLTDMLKTGRDQGLTGIEMLQGVVLFDDEWTPENGFVTSAQKLKRKDILNAVQSRVDKVYLSKR